MTEIDVSISFNEHQQNHSSTQNDTKTQMVSHMVARGSLTPFNRNKLELKLRCIPNFVIMLINLY